MKNKINYINSENQCLKKLPKGREGGVIFFNYLGRQIVQGAVCISGKLEFNLTVQFALEIHDFAGSIALFHHLGLRSRQKQPASYFCTTLHRLTNPVFTKNTCEFIMISFI